MSPLTPSEHSSPPDYDPTIQHVFEKDVVFDDPNIDTDSETSQGWFVSLSRAPARTSSLTGIRPAEWEEDSPYPEVRAAVSNTDDPTIPVGTVRVWVIGLLWAILIPGLNQFLYFRYPSITVGSVS